MVKLNRGKNAGGFNSESDRESDSDDSHDYDSEDDSQDQRTVTTWQNFRDEEGDDEEGFGEGGDDEGGDEEGFGEGGDDEGFGEGRDDDDETGEEQAPLLQAERDAFDRTGGIHTLLANCGKYTGNKTLQNNLTYEEIVACDINKVFNKYRTGGEDSIISKQDLYSLLDLSLIHI